MATDKLKAMEVTKATPGERSFKLSDGGGMYLLVDVKGGKYWRMDYRFAEKRKTLALGVFPEVSLLQARKDRNVARDRLRSGEDPGEVRKTAKLTAAHRDQNSFEGVAREWHKEISPDWSAHTRYRNLRILELNAFPWIGKRLIAEVTAPELLAVLRRVKDRGLLDTAHRLRETAGMVFRYGIRTGRCERDISADLKGALPTKQQTHYAAITDPAGFGALLRDLWAYKGSFATCCALKLSAFFGLRPGEVRSLEWAEVDTAQKLIRIPIGKMKARRLHLVPLADQALAILAELKSLTGAGRYCFPGLQNHDRPMSENTVNAALRRLGYDTQSDHSAHGFRSSFSTMAHGSGLFRSEAVEVQLSHVHGDEVRLAYDRGDFLEERRRLMTWWADECEKMRDTTNTGKT
ncbi:integrase arm-type DNA-binding domain-containing protein [Candidatus Accumulibacter sp. ACC007]|uniref:tyrosine-type recombinase/integrase n=1 Tax=Candidatus Accumulibacter sp. ACC007 TaxID=2823333 RepID=UPI0025C09905|nr:integrase arm-type DNA-binding domain-containing protein [Candidatus Accumulibacter sp. ACC007]